MNLLSIWGIKFQSYKSQEMILENNNTKQSQFFIKGTISKGYNLYNNNCTFGSPIYTFPWRENIIVYTPDQGTNREKYFDRNIYQRKKNADSDGN